MSNGGFAPPAHSSPPHRDAPALGWRGRLETLHRAALRQPIVLGVLAVTRAYDRGGGGMLSAGLSYFAFFTVVPALLLFVSLLGVIVESRDLRDQMVGALVDRLDPIRDVATVVIDGLADSGRTGTIIGVIGLVWGASGFYGALQAAMQRMFPGPGTRDFLQTRVRGVLVVVLILGSMVGAVVFIVALPLLSEWLIARCHDLDGLDAPIIEQACAMDLAGVGSAMAIVATMAMAFLAALLVYVAIPLDGPSLGQAFWPAVVVGVVVGSLTSLFGWIAPLLVRQWLALGIVGSVFISLVWFNLVFQSLMYGAAFARLRRDHDRTKAGPPTI